LEQRTLGISAFLAVGMGAAIGAWLRWGLSLWLNPIYSNIPLGTLAANLGGGYLIGLAVAFFAQHPGLSPEWRLLLITGFLGGLTTFSTFSAEIFTLFARAQMGLGLAAIGLHVLGSLAMTGLGVLTFNLLKG
jgi:CrcB protein